MKSEQGLKFCPLACTRSHIPSPLPVAVSGANTMQSDLSWSQRTSVIEKNQEIITFGLWGLNHLYLSCHHSTLHMAPTSMSENVTQNLVGSPLASPPAHGPMILWKDQRVAIHQSPFLAYSCIYQRSQWSHCYVNPLYMKKNNPLQNSRSNSSMNMRTYRPR